jgi:ubiquitin C-terminal hydrolase
MDKTTAYDPVAVNPPVGSHNLGATCWCNACMQALLSIPSIGQVLAAYSHEFRGNVLAEFWAGLSGASGRSTANDQSGERFLAAMQARAAKVRRTLRLSNEQHCADEALVMFVELMAHPAIEQLFELIYEMSIVCPVCSRASVVRDTRYRVQLYTPAELTGTFAKWLVGHTSICATYTCEGCKTTSKDIPRVEKLRRVSEVLVVTLGQFQRKERFECPHMVEIPGKTAPMVYKLVAIIEHSGTAAGGHYWAKCLRPEMVSGEPVDRWYDINDHSVTQIAKPEMTPAAFVLVYHLV